MCKQLGPGSQHQMSHICRVIFRNAAGEEEAEEEDDDEDDQPQAPPAAAAGGLGGAAVAVAAFDPAGAAPAKGGVGGIFRSFFGRP